MAEPSEPRREKTSPAPPETPAPPPPFPIMSGGSEMEVAPVSNWSPETDPNPVPRLVRARELGPDPAGPAEEPPPSPPESLREPAPGDPPPRPTFWKFGS